MKRDSWTDSMRDIARKAKVGPERTQCVLSHDGNWNSSKIVHSQYKTEERQISMGFYYIIKTDTSNQWIQVLEQLATSLEKKVWSLHFWHQNKLQMD